MPAPARREQLLDAAARLVATDGFHAASIEAVAQAADVTRALVYQHFRDLQELLEQLVAREMRRAQEQVAVSAIADLGDDPAEQLIGSLTAFLAAVGANVDTWRMVLLPPEGAPPALRRRIARGRRRVLSGLADAIERAAGEGAGAADSELSAHLLSAVADEYARLLLADPRGYPVERLLAHARGWLGHVDFGGRVTPTGERG